MRTRITGCGSGRAAGTIGSIAALTRAARRWARLIILAASCGLAALPAQAGDALVNATPTHPLRIITLAPSATELVFAAGAGDNIVGTVVSSDYPAAARAIPRVGDGIQLNVESILALNPDLLVAWQASNAIRALAALVAPLGVPILYEAPQSLPDIPKAIRRLGAKLGTAPIASAKADALQARINALDPGHRTLTVFIEVSADPLYTLGRDPLINDLLARCGAVNLYGDRLVAAPQINAESVLRDQPDVVIVSPYGWETLDELAGYWRRLRLPAAVQGHVYAIDPDWLHRPGPRMIDAAEAVCRDLARRRAAAH
ncbi:MAG: cobalamin-binding protein [Alcaligenaceae bacterium]|nr:cobalamin-binding protein [Alcaligenaceae bacterium]